MIAHYFFKGYIQYTVRYYYSILNMMAVTKSGTGTWDWDVGLGLGDVRLGDVRLGDVRLGDVRLGT